MKKYWVPGWLAALLTLCLLVTMVSLFIIRINDLDNIANKNRAAFCHFMRDRADAVGLPDDTPGSRIRNDQLAADAKQVMTELGCATQ